MDSKVVPALEILEQARACQNCVLELPLEPRPLLAATAKTRVLIIGQAPGKAAHESGIAWNDRSGDRLRQWLGVSTEQFYDTSFIGLVPMGFCYPGTAKSGDLPPRKECAPLWHERILAQLTKLELTIFVGQYAFQKYLSPQYNSLTDAVHAYSSLLPTRIAIPHPSPRNNIWLKKNAWFTAHVLPALQGSIKNLI